LNVLRSKRSSLFRVASRWDQPPALRLEAPTAATHLWASADSRLDSGEEGRLLIAVPRDLLLFFLIRFFGLIGFSLGRLCGL
jgi:hypothetical protein